MSVHGGPDTGQVEQLDVDGVALQVRTWGDPAGRPLLFWHPLGDVTSGAYLTELAPTLTARRAAAGGAGRAGLRRVAGAAARGVRRAAAGRAWSGDWPTRSGWTGRC